MSDENNVGNVESREIKYKRPSDRMFRRSRAAEMRRYKSRQAESRFLKIVTSVTSVITLIVFAIIIFFYKGTARAAETPQDDAPAAEQTTALTQPLFGNFTGLDLMGIAFVIVAGYAVWLKYQNKD